MLILMAADNNLVSLPKSSKETLKITMVDQVMSTANKEPDQHVCPFGSQCDLSWNRKYQTAVSLKVSGDICLIKQAKSVNKNNKAPTSFKQIHSGLRLQLVDTLCHLFAWHSTKPTLYNSLVKSLLTILLTEQ